MKRMIFVATALALSACSQAAPTQTPAQPSATPAAPAVAALVANGPAASLTPDTQEQVQTAASVTELTTLTHQGGLTAKLFGTSGGDPAMNGLYTYIAFFVDPQEGWRVFRIGDVLSYRVLNETAGRVDLEINESVMNEASGDISSRTRRVIVAWTPGADGAAPSAVTVTPAR